MGNTVYDVPFNSDYEFTFNVNFQEWAPLLEGLIYVYIGDGTSEDIIETKTEEGTVYTGGKGGYLYGKYSDGYWQDIGFVSDYHAAKKYYEDHGIQLDLTYEQWINYLMTVPSNAAQSMLWAYGRDEGEWSEGKSSREQANRSAVWAVGSTTDTDNGSETNNSKYWAEQSKSYADGKNFSGDPVEDRRSDNAEYFKDQAKLWTNYNVGGDNPSSTNNARSYSLLSKDWAVKITPVETSGGTTYESARTYAISAGQSAQSCTDQINAKLSEIQQATDNANTATSRANTAASSVENMSATATTLTPTSPATASTRIENSHYVIDFGIPKGDKGDPNYLATSYVDDANESGVVFDWSADKEALSAKTILFDPATSTPNTVYDVINPILSAFVPITSAEIDALFT